MICAWRHRCFSPHEERAQPGLRDNALTGPAISQVGLPLGGAFSFEEIRRPRTARVSPLTLGEERLCMRSKLSAFHSWANCGWPAIGLQSASGLLLIFGIGCVAHMRWGDFLFGPLFGFVAMLVGEGRLSLVGWVCLFCSAMLLLLTIPAQRRQFARLRRDQAMLQRQDWRR